MSTEAKKISGRAACIATLRAAEQPLSANAIATAVVESGVVPTLKGKTPKATLAAQITSGAKGTKGVFVQASDGRPKLYALADTAPESDADLVKTMKEHLAKGATSTPAPQPEPAPEATAQSGDLAKVKPKPDPRPKAAGGSARSRRASKKSTAAA